VCAAAHTAWAPVRHLLLSCRTYHVGSFSDAAKLLKQHSRPQQQSHKTVHKVLQELRPTAASVGSLLARLESAVMQHKGEPSM
jgi:hypothetical protein